MSQNKGKFKKYTLQREINLAFEQLIHFFDEIDQKLRKCKKYFFFKATTLKKKK